MNGTWIPQKTLSRDCFKVVSTLVRSFLFACFFSPVRTTAAAGSGSGNGKALAGDPKRKE